MNVKKKQSREEILEKKRRAEKLRYERLKNDPVKNAELKGKERQKYIKLKERGDIKSIKDMTTTEQKAIRKNWRDKKKKHRDLIKRQTIIKNPSTPSSNNEEISTPQQRQNNRASAARKRSFNQRKLRNKLIQKQKKEIKHLKEQIKLYEKEIKLINCKHQTMSNSTVTTVTQSLEEDCDRRLYLGTKDSVKVCVKVFLL